MSDFGNGKWVVGRKRQRCDGCLGPIPKGESYYNYRGMFAGEWQNWRMHRECHDSYEIDRDVFGVGEFTPGDFPMPERVRTLIGKWGR